MSTDDVISEQNVSDRDSFFALVRALIADREQVVAAEAASPSSD